MLLVRNIFEDILTYGNSMRYHESWKLILYYHLLILSSQYILCILKAIAYTNQQLVREWKYLLKFAKTKSGQYHKYFYIPSGAELLGLLQLAFNSTSCSSIIILWCYITYITHYLCTHTHPSCD